MELVEYLRRIGFADVEAYLDHYLINELSFIQLEDVDLSEEERDKLYKYPVPKMSPDGTCSMPDQLEDVFFDVQPYFQDDNVMVFLNKAIDLIHESTTSDWSGIYKKVGDRLVKVVYRGAPSRAEFPLTKEFADISNNVNVALTQKGILVKDVNEHVRENKPYYKCDPRVRSELCIPLIVNEKLWGIIDVESFEVNHYIPRRISALISIVLYVWGKLKE